MQTKKIQLALLVLVCSFLISEKTYANYDVGNPPVTPDPAGHGLTGYFYGVQGDDTTQYPQVTYFSSTALTPTWGIPCDIRHSNTCSYLTIADNGNRIGAMYDGLATSTGLYAMVVHNPANGATIDSGTFFCGEGEFPCDDVSSYGFPVPLDYSLPQYVAFTCETTTVCAQYFYASLPYDTTEPANDATRIISITSPLDYATTTTNVTFSGTYYLNSNYPEYWAGNAYFSSYIQIMITPRGQYSTTTAKILYAPITIVDQIATFNTSTTLEDNMRYSWTAQIWCLRTYDSFNSCDQTNRAGFYQFTTGNFDPSYGKVFDLDRCNPLNFNGNDCVYNLIYPNNATFPTLMQEVKDSYARAWPIGYITRILEIVSSSTPVKPPVLTIDLPIAGEVTLDPWPYMMGTSSILANAHAEITVAGQTKGDGRSLRQVTETWWVALWYFILGIAIIRDITKNDKKA